MTASGIIDGLPMLDYVKDPAPGPSLSASLAHILLSRSPQHAWMASARLNPAWEPDAMDPKQIVGTIAHAVLLEGDYSRVEVIDAEDYRKKETQALRDRSLASGTLPILAPRLFEVEAMIEAARAQIATSEVPELFKGGHAERTMIWPADGIWWRSRPDWISPDGRVIADLKTTGNAEPGAWARGPLNDYEFDLQAVLALRGCAATMGPADRSFIFVVIETVPPYALSLVSLAPQFIDFAERKLVKAGALWKACLDENRWPGYPSRVCWADPPPWVTTRWDERQLVSAAADHGEGEVGEL